MLGRAGNWGSSAGFFEGTRKGSETYLMLGVMSWVNRSERDAPNHVGQSRVAVWRPLLIPISARPIEGY